MHRYHIIKIFKCLFNWFYCFSNCGNNVKRINKDNYTETVLRKEFFLYFVRSWSSVSVSRGLQWWGRNLKKQNKTCDSWLYLYENIMFYQPTVLKNWHNNMTWFYFEAQTWTQISQLLTCLLIHFSHWLNNTPTSNTPSDHSRSTNGGRSHNTSDCCAGKSLFTDNVQFCPSPGVLSNITQVLLPLWHPKVSICLWFSSCLPFSPHVHLWLHRSAQSQGWSRRAALYFCSNWPGGKPEVRFLPSHHQYTHLPLHSQVCLSGA